MARRYVRTVGDCAINQMMLTIVLVSVMVPFCIVMVMVLSLRPWSSYMAMVSVLTMTDYMVTAMVLDVVIIQGHDHGHGLVTVSETL